MKITNLTLIGTCIGMPIDDVNKYLKNSTLCSGERLRNKIKTFIPDLYKEFGFYDVEKKYHKYFNPFEHHSRINKKLQVYIYVHSGIEYFLHYEKLNN